MNDSTRVQDDARIRYVNVKPDGTSTSTLMKIRRYTAVNTGHPLTDAMLNALGGTGLNSAIVLTGGTEVTRFEDGPPVERSNYGPRLGFNAEVYVRWRVNAGKRNLWYMAVALEPDETYTARLISVVPSVATFCSASAPTSSRIRTAPAPSTPSTRSTSTRSKRTWADSSPSTERSPMVDLQDFAERIAATLTTTTERWIVDPGTVDSSWYRNITTGTGEDNEFALHLKLDGHLRVQISPVPPTGRSLSGNRYVYDNGKPMITVNGERPIGSIVNDIRRRLLDTARVCGNRTSRTPS